MIAQPSSAAAEPAPAPAGGAGHPPGRPDAVAAERALVELLALRRELHEQDHMRRADGLDRAGEAVRRLGESGSPDRLLERAARELAQCAGFDRVLLSELVDGRLSALAAWDAGGADRCAELLEGLRAQPLMLQYPLIEVEVARGLGARLVNRASALTGLPGAWRRALGSPPYVVAALTAGAEAIGLLHAAGANRVLGQLDVEIAGRFAEDLSGVLERAILRHTLDLHRSELESAVRWMGGRLSRLAESGRPGGDRSHDASGQPAPISPLTPRELEVLRLLARGHTNRSIANALMVREGTVKYHVKNILRKLGATSRAEALSRFVRASAADLP